MNETDALIKANEIKNDPYAIAIALVEAEKQGLLKALEIVRSDKEK